MELTLKQQLRRQFKDKRNNLAEAEVVKASKIITTKISTLPEFIQAKNIALYWPCNNEVCTKEILANALAQNKKCFLPIINNTESVLLFQEINSVTPTFTHQNHGIPEVSLDLEYTIAANKLDLVIIPMVAFNKNNIRLGMGAGHYDKTFSFKADHPMVQPILLGIAYENQYINTLPTDPWDIPLEYIVTEQRIQTCNTG